MTTLRLFSPAAAVGGLFLLATACTILVSGCSHSDAGTESSPAAGGAAAHAQAQLTPQQQMQQIQANPNIPDKLKKVQMGNVSGPPLHNRVGGPP